MNVIDRIKELANERKISLAEVERRTGLSSGSITKWGKSSPSTDKLNKIADFFNVSIDYLAGRTDRKDPWPASDPYEDFADIEETDLEDMLDNAMAYGGKPLTEVDREAIRAYIEGRISSK